MDSPEALSDRPTFVDRFGQVPGGFRADLVLSHQQSITSRELRADAYRARQADGRTATSLP